MPPHVIAIRKAAIQTIETLAWQGCWLPKSSAWRLLPFVHDHDL